MGEKVSGRRNIGGIRCLTRKTKDKVRQYGRRNGISKGGFEYLKKQYPNIHGE